MSAEDYLSNNKKLGWRLAVSDRLFYSANLQKADAKLAGLATKGTEGHKK